MCPCRHVCDRVCEKGPKKREFFLVTYEHNSRIKYERSCVCPCRHVCDRVCEKGPKKREWQD